MELGKLKFVPVGDAMDLVGDPVRQHIEQTGADGLWVSEIDPDLADTAAFCEQYDIGLEISANCVVVEAKRADRVWHAACMVLATTRADVNGIVRKHLDARKISFASMDTAVSLTGMEYGGITPSACLRTGRFLSIRMWWISSKSSSAAAFAARNCLPHRRYGRAARCRGAHHHQGRLAGRQHQGRLVVGMEAEEEPGARRHQRFGLGLAHQPGIGDQHRLAVLVNACRSAGQHVLDPV